MEYPILEPGTGAGNSASFAVERNIEVTVMLYPEANLGADTAVLKRQALDGTWSNCKDINGIITLSAARPQEVIFGPGAYRLEVAARAAAWGISANLD